MMQKLIRGLISFLAIIYVGLGVTWFTRITMPMEKVAFWANTSVFLEAASFVTQFIGAPIFLLVCWRIADFLDFFHKVSESELKAIKKRREIAEVIRLYTDKSDTYRT